MAEQLLASGGDAYLNQNDLEDCVCGRRRGAVVDNLWRVSDAQDFVTPSYYFRCQGCGSFSAVNLHFEVSAYAGSPIEYYCITEEKRELNRRRVAWIEGAIGRPVDGRPVIYDLGAGEGAFMAAFREACPEARIVAVEADQRMPQKFVDEYAGAEVVSEYIEPFLARAARDPQADIVLLTDVLEHVLEPRKMLAALMAVLKPGGVAYVTVPNARSYPTARPVAAADVDWALANQTRQHLWMMNPAYMLQLVSEAGEVLEYSRSFEERIRRDGAYSTFLLRR